jgi:hypothetical protein
VIKAKLEAASSRGGRGQLIKTTMAIAAGCGFADRFG